MVSFRKKHESVGDNETFVRLIQAAMEDQELQSKLVAILSLDKFSRKSVLNTFLGEMRLKQAPQEFVAAIASLLDDGIAKRALEILKR